MVAAEKLAIYLIPLIVLVLLGMFYYGPSGAFGKAQNVTAGVINFVNATIGANELAGGAPTIPENHREAIKKLNETIQNMLAFSNNNCFANYGGFPDLGEEGTSIIMVYNEQADRTDFRILGGEGGQQLITDLSFSIEGMHPCVVAGEEVVQGNDVIVPKEFYRHFLNSQRPGSTYGFYNNPVSEIKILYSDGGVTGSAGNIIRVLELGPELVNDQNNNLEDGGWLLKAGGVSGKADICFFPTIYGNCGGENDPDGLDNDCLNDDSEDESLISMKNQGTLNLCYTEIDLMSRACETNDYVHCHKLALLHFDILRDEAINLLESNCDHYAESCIYLADYYAPISNPATVRTYQEKACLLNNWEACENAGNIWANFWGETSEGKTQALIYYDLACQHGVNTACAKATELRNL